MKIHLAIGFAMLLLAGCSITVTNASDDETITSVGLAKFGTNDEGNSILLPGTTITNGTLAPGESVSESFLSPGTYRIVVEYLDSRGDDRAEFENREVRLLDPFQQWDWPGSGN